MSEIIVGIDIGGTKIEACFYEKSSIDNSLSELRKKRIPTQRDKGYEFVLENIVSLLKELLSESSLQISDINAIGIGLPGTVDPKTTMMSNGNTGIFIGNDFGQDLKEKLKTNSSIFIANDANCFALAEARLGAGLVLANEKNTSVDQLTTLGVILGTGCGGGLCINGKIHAGANGAAAEIGHMILVTNGTNCFCGQRGCAEQYLSGSAFENIYNLKVQSEDPKSGKEIFDLIHNKDSMALDCLNHYKENLTTFLRMMCSFYDPDLIVFGGGLSNQEMIYQGIEQKLKEINFIKGTSPAIRKNTLGDSAGVLGAALLTRAKDIN